MQRKSAKILIYPLYSAYFYVVLRSLCLAGNLVLVQNNSRSFKV